MYVCMYVFSSLRLFQKVILNVATAVFYRCCFGLVAVFVQGCLILYVCVPSLSQGQESGGPRHQHGSSVGAAGSGHEPQSAHVPGAGRRAHPGELVGHGQTLRSSYLA